MGQARRFSTKTGFFLSFSGLAVCFACSSSFTSSGEAAGASGDSAEAGSSDEAGALNDAGSPSGGSPAGGADAGGSHSGGSDSGGATSGGTSAAGADSGGTGGLINLGGTGGLVNLGGGGGGKGGSGSTCPPECLRAVQCVDHCGGPVVSSGCCCIPPLIDKDTCAHNQ